MNQNGPGNLDKKNSQDDSGINIAGSPSRTVYETPFQVSESLSDTADFGDILRRSAIRLSLRDSVNSVSKWPRLTGESTPRISRVLNFVSPISEASLQNALSPEKMTLTLLSHFDADAILQEDSQDRELASNRLQFFLSTGRDEAAFKKLTTQLQVDKMRLTRELRWYQFLMLCINKVLAEKFLTTEHEDSHTKNRDTAQRIAREFRWSQIVSRVIAEIKPNTKRDIIQGRVEDEIGQECARFSDATQGIYTAEERKAFDAHMHLYFRFRSVQTKLIDSLAGKTDEELQILSERYHSTPVTIDEFVPVGAQTYVVHELEEMREYCRQDMTYSATAQGISDEKVTRDVQSIIDYLKLKMSSEEYDLVSQLENATSDELHECYQSVKDAKNQIEDERICVDENFACYEQLAQNTRNQLIHHPMIRQKHAAFLPTPARAVSADLLVKELGETSHRQYLENLREKVTPLVAQPVDLLLEVGDRNLLEKAIASKNLLFIKDVLSYAEHSHVLVALLHATLLKLDKEAFKTLIAGAYVFDPVQGGLYNPLLVKKICEHKEEYYSSATGNDELASYFDKAIDTPRTTPIKNPQLEEQHAPSQFSCFFSDAQLLLSSEEQTEINTQLLQQADDKTLVLFLERVECGNWPHPIAYSALEIRRELKRRYLNNDGTSKTSVPETVRAVLNKNLAIAERGERLAIFYDRQTRHVCVSYLKDTTIYQDKAGVILEKFKEAAHSIPSEKKLDTLESEATAIANALTDSVSPLNGRRSGCVGDPHVLSKTQRLFADARAMLPSTSVFASIQKTMIRVANALPGAERQNDHSVLTRPIETIDAGLTDTLLEKIPLTAEEKKDCVKRAALARGAFKHTLEYLEYRKYGKDKKQAMDGLIQKYVNGRDESGASYSAQNLIADLKEAAQEKGTLGTRVGWFGSKTVSKLEDDLRRSEQMLCDFGHNRVAAA